MAQLPKVYQLNFCFGFFFFFFTSLACGSSLGETSAADGRMENCFDFTDLGVSGVDGCFVDIPKSQFYNFTLFPRKCLQILSAKLPVSLSMETVVNMFLLPVFCMANYFFIENKLLTT